MRPGQALRPRAAPPPAAASPPVRPAPGYRCNAPRSFRPRARAAHLRPTFLPPVSAPAAGQRRPPARRSRPGRADAAGQARCDCGGLLGRRSPPGMDAGAARRGPCATARGLAPGVGHGRPGSRLDTWVRPRRGHAECRGGPRPRRPSALRGRRRTLNCAAATGRLRVKYGRGRRSPPGADAPPQPHSAAGSAWPPPGRRTPTLRAASVPSIQRPRGRRRAQAPDP